MLYPMKNIKIFAFLAVFLLSAAVSSAWAWKGSGTSDAPYQITSAADLTQRPVFPEKSCDRPKHFKACGAYL